MKYSKDKISNRTKFPVEYLLAKPALNVYDDENYDLLLGDLQANILKHHRKEFIEYHFLKFKSRDGFTKFLFSLSTRITSAKLQFEERKRTANNQNKFRPILNVYLTHAGYQFLELIDNQIPSGIAFKKGFDNRINLNKRFVEHKNLDLEIHAIITLAYNEEQAKKVVKGTFDGKTDTLLWSYLNKNEKWRKKLISGESIVQKGIFQNPFTKDLQFRDGISNPQFFPGYGEEKGKDEVAYHAIETSKLPPLSTALVHDRSGGNGFSCGTYGAFAKFHINELGIKKLFEQFEKKGFNKGQTLAYVMGRFPDGTPLTLSNESIGYPTNRFNYKELIKINRVSGVQDDSQGNRCPFHTHIRKANPRDDRYEKMKIVRRSVFYNEGNEKGLLFISFQHSLKKQFEEILNNWMLNTYIKTGEEGGYKDYVQTGKDMLFAQKGDTYQIPKSWNRKQDSKGELETIKIEEELIIFKQGVYFYTPPISFFKRIKLLSGLNPSRRKKLSNSNNIRSVPPIRQLIGDKDQSVLKEFEFIPGTEIKINVVNSNEKIDAKFKFL